MPGSSAPAPLLGLSGWENPLAGLSPAAVAQTAAQLLTPAVVLLRRQ